MLHPQYASPSPRAEPWPAETETMLEQAIVLSEVALPPHGYTSEHFSSATVYVRLLHLPSSPDAGSTQTGRGERWLLTLGPGVDVRAEMIASRSTFELLYALVHTRVGLFAGQPVEAAHVTAHWADAAGMLHAFLINSYDTTDETEAAEQALVALGANPSVLPRSLIAVPVAASE